MLIWLQEKAVIQIKLPVDNIATCNTCMKGNAENEIKFNVSTNLELYVIYSAYSILYLVNVDFSVM